KIASRRVSETWSGILSGCPSVTDSDVKIYFMISAIQVFELMPVLTSRDQTAASRLIGSSDPRLALRTRSEPKYLVYQSRGWKSEVRSQGGVRHGSSQI